MTLPLAYIGKRMVTTDWIFLFGIIGMIAGSVLLIVFLNKTFGIKDEDD